MALYLAFKEIWRGRSKFFLFSLVIALITVLVLFVAALAQGLALANKEYLEKLDAQLLVFQAKSDLSTAASQVGRSKVNNVSHVEGVAEAASIGFSSASLAFSDGRKATDISLIGVEAGKPGEPPILQGAGFKTNTGSFAILDGKIASKYNLHIGDTITLKTVVEGKDKFNQLKVAGISSGQQYLFRPSIFIPLNTWDQIRPQGGTRSMVDLVTNVIAVKLEPGSDLNEMTQRITSSVNGVEVADIKTAYESSPGYSAQQSTLNTIQAFTLLIGTLVIGGFFQIQMLQKVPLIGVLKAIGTSNSSVAASVVYQIIMVTFFGVALGGLVVLLLALFLPSSVPIAFDGPIVFASLGALLLIGPMGGLVSVRLAVGVEPLRALGLSS